MDIAELKSAWLASGLWRTGQSFDQAMAKPILRRQIDAHARALRTILRRKGKPAPQQQEFTLCND